MTINKGLQQLLEAKPELFDEVRQTIECLNIYLNGSTGDDARCLPVWGDALAHIRDEARKIPVLAAWAKQLDDFEATEHAKVMRSTRSLASAG